MTIIHDETRVPEFLKMISELSTKQVEIGILGEGAGGAGHKGSDMTVLGIATVHEYGVTISYSKGGSITIPERSFIRAGFDANEPKFQKEGQALLEQVISMDVSTDAFFNALGESIVGTMQEFLTNLSSPPNSSVTVGLKGSSSPLIDTGQLRDSIEYKVVSR